MDNNDLERILSHNEPVLENLKHLWKECGFSTEEIRKRHDMVKEEIEVIIRQIVLREQKMKQDMILRKNSLRHDAEKLSTELDTHFDATLYDNLPLCEALTEIQSELEKLKVKKSAHMEELSEIAKEEADLCSCLGERVEIILKDTLPTREEIATFNQRLNTLKVKKAALFRLFKNTRFQIISFMRELEYNPNEDFEMEVVCDDCTKFKLSKENMAKLTELELSLKKKVLERTEYVNNLHERVTKLWIRLHENSTYRGNFLAANGGMGISTVAALEQEIRRCENMRRENMPQYIKAVREEIQEYWDKCCYGKLQRLSLLEFYSEGVSELLLQRLEEEVCRLQKYHSENRHLLGLAAEHKHLREKFHYLGKKSQDKDRLFKNRGGELLKEERESNHIQKELPKIEAELKALLKRYTQLYNEPFYFYDEDLSEKLESLEKNVTGSRQKYKSSSQKKILSSKENGGVKRKLEMDSTLLRKRPQFAMQGNVFEFVPPMHRQRNVTHRQLFLPPMPKKNERLGFGIAKIDDENFPGSQGGIQEEAEAPSCSASRREVFREVNNTESYFGFKASKIPTKPPRKNMGMTANLKRKSSEIIISQNNRKRLRRSSLPDINAL